MAIILKKKNSAEIPTPPSGKVTVFVGPDGNPQKKDEFGVTHELFTLPTSTYQHTQFAPSVTWIVYHALGEYPFVEVIDDTGCEMEAEVAHIDINTTEIRFVLGKTGTAKFKI